MRPGQQPRHDDLELLRGAVLLKEGPEVYTQGLLAVRPTEGGYSGREPAGRHAVGASELLAKQLPPFRRAQVRIELGRAARRGCRGMLGGCDWGHGAGNKGGEEKGHARMQ